MARVARTLTHRWQHSLLAGLAVVGLFGVLAAGGEPATDDFRVPGSESQQALDLFKTHSPATAGVDSQIPSWLDRVLPDIASEGRLVATALPSRTD